MQSLYASINRTSVVVLSVELVAIALLCLSGLAVSAALLSRPPAEELERILAALG
jgi:hypothetical protein